MSAEVWQRSELSAETDSGATAAFLGQQTSYPASPPPRSIHGQAPRPIDREIKRTLHRYQKALRTSNPEGVLAVYRPDAVLMPQSAPAFVGRDAVLRAHQLAFANAALEVAFDIYEAEVMGEGACARTVSTARTSLANGAVIERSNYELFVFRRAGLRWLIHRYLLTTNWPLHE